jgi:hypothetical protein
MIKDGCANFEAMIGMRSMGTSSNTVLALAAGSSQYHLTQWLVEEGALLPISIWEMLNIKSADVDVSALSLLLKVLTQLPMSPEHDHHLPTFVATLSPQHAELCTRGRQLRAQLPAYLEEQRASVATHCALPAVLQAMVTAYALPTPEDLWSDGLQGLDIADIGEESRKYYKFTYTRHDDFFSLYRLN